MENSNEEYEFIKFDTKFRTWQKLKDGYAYVYRFVEKSPNYNLTFPKVIRDIVFKRGLTTLSIAQSKYTGDLLFIFQKESGPLKVNDAKTNCYVSRKAVSDFLSKHYGRPLDKNDKYKLKLSENLAKTEDILTYRVLKMEER